MELHFWQGLCCEACRISSDNCSNIKESHSMDALDVVHIRVMGFNVLEPIQRKS